MTHCLSLFILSNILNPVLKLSTESHFHKVGKMFLPHYKKSELVKFFFFLNFQKSSSESTLVWAQMRGF